MKKGLLVAFCSLLTFSSLVSCNDSNPDDKNPTPEEVVKEDATLKINQSEGGSISFVRPDDYKYKVGDLCPLDIEPNEGYRILYVKINDKKIRPIDGDYIFEVSEKEVNINALFEKIKLDIRDFTFVTDETNNTAKIVKYVPMGGLVPTPFIIPETTKIGDKEYRITGIGSEALSNSQISKLHLSKNIETLENGVLNSILTLKEITVDEGNKNFKAVDGDLYNKDLTELISVPYYKKGTYQVKDSVVKIADYAFRNNGFIRTLKMNDNVTTLGVNVFQEMRDLQVAELSNSITSIPDNSFDHCSELGVVNIPTSATSIGFRAFNFCNNISNVTIPASVLTIDDEAFFHIKYLHIIKFSEGLESIGKFAFGQCDYVEVLNFPSTLKIIGDYAFDECKSLREVNLNKGLVEIGDCAFQLCYEIESIVLPVSLTTLGKNPFSGCAKLALSLEEGEGYFEVENGILFNKGKTSLLSFPYDYKEGNSNEVVKEYVIPDSVTTIANRAFAFNIQLTKITIHGAVESMKNAFYNLLPEGNIPGNYQLELHYLGTKAEFSKKFLQDPFNNKAFFKDDLVHCEDGTIELIPFVDESEEANKDMEE